MNVLVWGASGGLGVFGVQLCAASGAHAIGVISDPTKADYVRELGAKGVIIRKDFNCWGQLPKVNSPEYAEWTKEARKFGKAIWDITGQARRRYRLRASGRADLPGLDAGREARRHGGVLRRHDGFNITFDARYVWMRQKRIQGSHFAHLKQATQANRFILDRRIDPCMSEVLPWAEIPHAHTKMWKNQHLPGNMAVLVNSPRPGLRTLDDVLEAGSAA
jgi:crotonyl-CoA carboxylase/reductase